MSLPPIIDQTTLARLALVDESAMPDTCSVRTRPAVANPDFGGGDDGDDSGWPVLTYTHRDGTTNTAIPCRVGVVPVRSAQAPIQGAEATLYTYLAAVPLALAGRVKPGDHIVWQTNTLQVAEPRIGSYSTSLVLACNRLG